MLVIWKNNNNDNKTLSMGLDSAHFHKSAAAKAACTFERVREYLVLLSSRTVAKYLKI